MLATAAFGAIGFADDYLKIVAPLAPRPAARATRWAWQIVVGLAVGVALLVPGATRTLYNTRLIFPFFKRLIPDLGWFYVPFAVVRARRRDRTPST